MPSYLHPPVTSSSIKTRLRPRRLCLLGGSSARRAAMDAAALLRSSRHPSSCAPLRVLRQPSKFVPWLRCGAPLRHRICCGTRLPASAWVASPTPPLQLSLPSSGPRRVQVHRHMTGRSPTPPRVHCAASLQLLHDLATVRGGTAVVAGCISTCALFSRYASALPASAPTR